MSLSVKTSKGIRYLYFQAGRESIYIGPEGEPDKAKADNVARALDYAAGRMRHYAASYDALLDMLPPGMRERYAAGHAGRRARRPAGRGRRAA